MGSITTVVVKPPENFAADQGYLYRENLTAADVGGFPGPKSAGVTRFPGWPRINFGVKIVAGSGNYQYQAWFYDEILDFWIPQQAQSATNTNSILDVPTFRFRVIALKIVSMDPGLTLSISATPHIE